MLIVTMLSSENARDVAMYIYNHPHMKVGVLSAVGIWLLKSTLLTWWWKRKASWRRKVRKGLAEHRKNLVRKQCYQASSPKHITEKSAPSLIRGMKDGKLTAVQVLHSFQKEALELTQRVNCVTEPIVEAEVQAMQLDREAKKEGLLFGLPVSVKESIGLAGYDATAGMACFIDQIYKEDAVLIQVLKHHGAVPFMRTNIPQTMLSYSCRNPLYGETLNPHDESRGPGGSSGGEGAIIGGSASVVGIGSDIGGSLRVPAEFCEIYTLKPTSGRLSSMGTVSTGHGNMAIAGTVGPMARDFDSLMLMSRALFSPKMFELDSSLPPLPFNEQLYDDTSPLHIGFYTSDGAVKCLPPNSRAVMEAKSALEKMGHTVVPFDFPKLMGQGFPHGEYYIRLLLLDRTDRLRKLLAYDSIESGLKLILFGCRLPVWFIKCVSSVISLKDKLLGTQIGSSTGFRSVNEYYAHASSFLKWQEAFMKVWKEQKLDAVICPVFPCPAVTKEIVPKITVCGTYCQMYNSLNYPCGVLPITKVTDMDIQATFDPKEYSPDSSLEKLLMKSTKGSTGMSIGVQCVALPFRDELCLRVMRDLEMALNS